jgi:hypothetical protein
VASTTPTAEAAATVEAVTTPTLEAGATSEARATPTAGATPTGATSATRPAGASATPTIGASATATLPSGTATAAAAATAAASRSGSSAPPVFGMSVSAPASAIVSRSSVLPGDSWSYDLAVRNVSEYPFTYVLSTSASTSSALDDPMANGLPASAGLQLSLMRCDDRYAQCVTLYDGPVRVTNAEVGKLAAKQQDYLRVGVRLPANSSNAFQSLTSVIDLAWIAVETASTLS